MKKTTNFKTKTRTELEKMILEFLAEKETLGTSIIRTRSQKRQLGVFNVKASIPKHFHDKSNGSKKQVWYDSY